MILVKAKFLRSRVDDREFDGKTTRHYLFDCQKTDLDGSLVPAIFSTKNLDSAKVLESHLSDKQFHFLPINNARVNAYNMNGSASFVLDDNLILHPDFLSLDEISV